MTAGSALAHSAYLERSALVLVAWAAPTIAAAVVIAAVEPLAGLAVPVVVSLVALVVSRPVRAAYLHLALAPLLAGFGRGSALPLVRPDEAVLALLGVAVGIRLLFDGVLGNGRRPPVRYRVTTLDRSIVAMAVFSSVVPLLWRVSRGFRPLPDDLLYATTMWKYLMVFILFRLVVTGEAQVWMCIKIMLAVGVVVGVVAVAQSVGVPGVPRFLAWLHGEPLAAVANNRGSSTLGTSHGTADLMAFNLGTTLALWHLRIGSRSTTAAAAGFFGLACLASGQISAAIALLVVAGTFGFLTGRLGRTLIVAVPATALAGVLLWPVVQARLAGTGTDRIPDSWEARYFNLTNYFWPELFRSGNWLLGVRPAGRLPSFEPWREWVYIESGHTWLLWTGGIPMALAFLWFTWRSLRISTALAASSPPRMVIGPSDTRGSGSRVLRGAALASIGPVVGLATAVAVSVVFVLMLFDVHLTLRGPAETLFPLLALTTVPVLWDSSLRWDRIVAGDGGRWWSAARGAARPAAVRTIRRFVGGAAIVLVAVGVMAGCSSGTDSTGNAVSRSAVGDGEPSIASERDGPDGGPIATDDDDVADVAAPLAVVAVQGPVDEAASYVAVSWSHIDLARHPDQDPLATGYEIARNGRIVGETEVDEEVWDDLAFREPGVQPGLHRYQVRAITDSGAGPWSDPVGVSVRGNDDVGPVFAVDDYEGTDLERAEQAVADADDAGGGVVLFGDATYNFDDTLFIDGDGIILRGAGQSETVLRPSFPGTADSCGRVTPLLLFRGDPEELDARVATDVARGSTEIPLDGPTSLDVGDFVEFDGVVGQLPTYEYPALGIAQDPSTGDDERYPFDGGTVIAVSDDTVTIDHPTSPILTEGSRVYRYGSGRGNGVELLTVEGGGADDETYHRLLDIGYQIDFHLADVTARWANRNFLDASGHGITIVGLTGIEGGAAGYEPEPCKYKVGFGPATDVVVVDSVLGSPDHDRNMSLMTTQFVYRALVRNTVFGGSRTYGFNEHGGGSRDLVVENNWFGTGPTGWAGILLGNDTWGFGGETAIRSNQFVDNVVDVLMVENPYGVVVAGNRSVGCVDVCLSWSGWGVTDANEADGADSVEEANNADGADDADRPEDADGADVADVADGPAAADGDGTVPPPIADPADYGSARLVVTGNHMVSSGGGLALGTDDSNGYPWTGIRDAAVTGNVVESGDEPALQILGDGSLSGRLWVSGNRLEGEVTTPEPGDDWWWWANTAGPDTSEQPLPDWMKIHQSWELDRSER